MQLEDTDNKSTHKIYKFKLVLHIVITSMNELILSYKTINFKHDKNEYQHTHENSWWEDIININSKTLSREYYFAIMYFWREAE